LLTHAAGLKERLGPILLQLPPTLRRDIGLLEDTLACFPATVAVAVEPRHDSWLTDDVRGLLERRGAALCWADRRSRPVAPTWRTASWGYLRLHEGDAEPWPRYETSTLARWLNRVADAWRHEAPVYVYFNNDPGGAAVYDADALTALARRAGRTVVRPDEKRC
jgi:uncharacterized protein YecE (DUF72 family)